MQRPSVLFRPDNKSRFPITEYTASRAVKRDAVSLYLACPVIPVETEATPVVVSIIGIGGEL